MSVPLIPRYGQNQLESLNPGESQSSGIQVGRSRQVTNSQDMKECVVSECIVQMNTRLFYIEEKQEEPGKHILHVTVTQNKRNVYIKRRWGTGRCH